VYQIGNVFYFRAGERSVSGDDRNPLLLA